MEAKKGNARLALEPQRLKVPESASIAANMLRNPGKILPPSGK
jgi:hypothetical protein